VVDARYDALNPRTAMRELPRGAMTPPRGHGVRRGRVGGVPLRGHPVGVGVWCAGAGGPGHVFWYSLAKRVTPYTQFFLGLAMAVAPVGGWLAAGGGLDVVPWLLGLAIGLWVGGFDILYACQDVDFDRGHGLRSIPTRFGVATAIGISRVMHVATVAAMAALGAAAGLPALYYGGVVFVAALLVYEQSLVSASDLSQVKRAFDLNGYVGIVYLAATALALYVG
jgi:4-hydroxybenzoate polyprenyltransferase